MDMEADLRFLNLEGLDTSQVNQLFLLLHPSNISPKIEFPWSICCNGNQMAKKGNNVSLNVHAPVFETHSPLKNNCSPQEVYFSTLYKNGSNYLPVTDKSTSTFYEKRTKIELQSFSNGVNHEERNFSGCASPKMDTSIYSTESSPSPPSFKLNPTVSCFVPQSVRTTSAEPKLILSQPQTKSEVLIEAGNKQQTVCEPPQSVSSNVPLKEVAETKDEPLCDDIQSLAQTTPAAPLQNSNADVLSANSVSSVATRVETPAPSTVKPVSRSWAQIVQSGQKPSGKAPSTKPLLENGCKSKKESKDEEKLSINDDKLALALGRHLYELELDFKPVSLQPRGLINRRNWCYINATLQALFGCSPFYTMIRNLPIGPALERGKSSTPVIDSIMKMTYEFSELPSSQLEEIQVGQPFQPDIMYDMLRDLKSDCLKGQQEDAEEFLSFILNNMHEEMVKIIKNYEHKNCISVDGGVANDHADGSEDGEEEEEWQVIGSKHKGMVIRKVAEHKTPISDLLGGQIKSLLTTSGNKTSASIQPFFTLQLDVQSENVTSVSEALKEMTVKEPIQGYTCAKTKQVVEAYSHVALQKLPPVLILHLKRFVYNKNGGCKKVMKKTDYPLELELNRELFSSDVKKSHRTRVYKLFAVMYHDGEEAIKGHYISDVYNPGSQTWFRFDDRQVTAVTEAQVLSHSPPRVPYLLFYQDAASI